MSPQLTGTFCYLLTRNAASVKAKKILLALTEAGNGRRKPPLEITEEVEECTENTTVRSAAAKETSTDAAREAVLSELGRFGSNRRTVRPVTFHVFFK